jgi:hypothetical protein
MNTPSFRSCDKLEINNLGFLKDQHKIIHGYGSILSFIYFFFFFFFFFFNSCYLCPILNLFTNNDVVYKPHHYQADKNESRAKEKVILIIESFVISSSD